MTDDAVEPIHSVPMPRAESGVWPALARVCLGVAVTLAVYGYQFGRGNHAAYLLDALRRVDPSVLKTDWFTTQTFQYHVVFSEFAAMLMRLGLVEAGFAISYVLLLIAFHTAWRGIVRQIGGTDAGYLMSVALYYLGAAGTGLGMYQFFQDSSLLPSNIANVALLCGLWLWVANRQGWAGACFGIAGLFHLNHALVGAGIWLTLCLWQWRRPGAARLLGASAIGILPGAINIALAAHLKLARSGAMPLKDFVDLYVRFRHPHHYDPSSWPIGIWIGFAWTVVPALCLRGPWRRIVLMFLLLIVVALIGAGIWYFSETLIQLSLYRFCIYVQLLGCIAASQWLGRLLDRQWITQACGAVACVAIVCICTLRGPFFGVFHMPADDTDYVSLCRWVRQNTPPGATLLVPPDEESMRLIGQRAIIVSYKGVPQLSSELLQWRQRMQDVLAIPELTRLPRGYGRTLHAIRARYDALGANELLATANKYHASYIVTDHALAGMRHREVPTRASTRYILYDLSR